MTISGLVRHHLGSIGAALAGTPLWVWPLPSLLVTAILLLLQTPLGWLTEKPVQEIIAPAVIGLTALFVLYVHWRVREFFTLLLALFVWALFFRELHFQGTNRGFYIAALVLAAIASTKREAIHEFLGHLPIKALLAAALWTYIVTKMFDRHYVSFLPGYLTWHDNVEETLETLAHLLVFSAVLATLRFGVTFKRGATRPAGQDKGAGSELATRAQDATVEGRRAGSDRVSET